MLTHSLFSFALLALSALTAAGPIHHKKTRTQHDPWGVVTGPKAHVTSAAGLSWYSSSITAGTSGVSPANKYTCFSGPASNFPPMSQWINYKQMFGNAVYFAFAQPSIGDSNEEIAFMNKSIIAVSKAAKVDPRFILATILVESTGKVDVMCTPNGNIHNCGLMQAYNSSAYNPRHSAKSIQTMIVEGAQGTKSGPGHVQIFNDAIDTQQEAHGNVYAVARAYNSGSVNATNLSSTDGTTPSFYVSNIANYLLGWNGQGNGPATCNFSGQQSGGTSAPGPTQPGVAANCNKWIVAQAGTDCQNIAANANISLQKFYQLNPAIDSTCSNLWAGYAYCVGTA